MITWKYTRFWIRTICVLVGIFSVTRVSLAADFYVSNQGADDWSGQLATPNADGTDGPFSSLPRARDAVREMNRQETGAEIVVQIRGGLYRLDETVVFSLKDSGRGEAMITYEAYPGERPVFSSGKEVEGWKLVTRELPGLPKEAQGNVWEADVASRFYTLFDKQGLLPRARSEGFQPEKGGSKTLLRFPEGRLKNWLNLQDVEIVIRPQQAWTLNILPLESVDETDRVAHTPILASYPMVPLFLLRDLDSCWVENVLEALDEPGEWVLNTQEQKLYLWPRGDFPVLRPQLKELIRVEGDIDLEGPTDRPVRNLQFRGLSFMHADRYSILEGDKGLQHDWDLFDKGNAMLRFRGAQNCAVENCTFTNSGGGAVRFDLHAQQNRVVGNQINHIGSTGILFCGYGPGTKDVNHSNLVSNNHIHNTGLIYAHSPGIMLSQSGENRVSNNLIHHTPYSGIIIAGVVTKFFHRESREMSSMIRWHEVEGEPGERSLEAVYPYLHTHDNQIEYNEIHHVMQQLNDGNGIYIRGSGPNNVIRGNYIHHMLNSTVMQGAIRTDGGQRDTLITENLIYRCVSQGMQVKLNNQAVNNFVIDIPPGYHYGEERVIYIKLYEGPMDGGAYKRNVLYHLGEQVDFYKEGKSHRVEFGAYVKDADTDYNIYYSAANPELGESFLEKKKAEGVDANSLALDPLFMDVENGDFRFHPDSPALKLGIKPFDMSKVGLIGVRQ
ncbi:MAG: right-handed parallel beta-helix repeat-containing protein [Opitutaceae bacterium]